MKKVLIISYSFPPINNIASRRYGEMATYMSDFGWEPFVLTTKSSGDLVVEIPEKNIIRVGGHYQKGLNIEHPGANGLPKLLRPGYHFYKKLNLNLRSVDMFLLSSIAPLFKKLNYIRKINPDIILASYGPAVSLWMGNLISGKIKKPWIADFRDPCSLINYSPGMVLDKYIDKALVKSASGIITVSPLLAEFLAKFYNKKAEVVFNGFRMDNTFERRHEKKPIKTEKKVIYYAGRFIPEQMKSVKLLIEWLVKSGRDDIIFTIRSLGSKEMNDQVISYAKSLGVSNLIDILEPAEEEIIRGEIVKADIVTVFIDVQKDEPVSAGTITGKLLKLLPLGIPIITIGREDSNIGKILNDTKTGFLVSNFEELNIVMEKIFSGALMPRPVWNEIQKYSSESQCGNLCNFLNQFIKKPGSGI